MTNESRTEQLIDALAARAEPVRPLAPPLWRALLTLSLLLLAGTGLVLAAGDVPGLLARYSGRELLMAAEMAAMLVTASLAIVGAFFLSVPGRSSRWLVAPLPSLLAWIALSGIGCVQDLSRLGLRGWSIGDSPDCLLFILAASIVIGAPLLWRLSRARPIDPLPVALLGGLGAAALSAFLLQFFHPFALTVIDLAVHFAAVLLVVAAAAWLRRRALQPA